jgi:hypothetical protein
MRIQNIEGLFWVEKFNMWSIFKELSTDYFSDDSLPIRLAGGLDLVFTPFGSFYADAGGEEYQAKVIFN